MAKGLEQTITKDVLKRMSPKTERRLRQVMTSLIQHAHEFVRETEITEAEWFAAIQFLTRTGHMCQGGRQEFILLSDTLGVSMLVDAINHRVADGATESTVLGPFHVPNAKAYPLGASIAHRKGGQATVVTGRVLSTGGKPIAGAQLDVWQSGPNGKYDVQEPEFGENLRGRFKSDQNGEFWFRTVKPRSYPIPNDGPVGKMLGALGRHPWRPAHLHFIVTAKGYQPVVTHLFVKGDRYLDSDAVFGVKKSLIIDWKRRGDPKDAAQYKVKAPFFYMHHVFKLKPAK